ncbi:MAG: HTTM domain-containing protein [Fimbriimonas sp.]|nr:HTTM domain-containing protein [Fimbriimonas sp.]
MTPQATSSGGLRDTIRTLDRYWFGFGSPAALGVFRIVSGFLILCNFHLLSYDWSTWFSERGYVPAWMGARFLWPRVPVGFGTGWSLPRIDVLSGVTNDQVSLAVFSLTALAALLTCLGLWTRLSSIILAVGVVSLHHRNSAILHGGDTVVRLASLYLAIAPSGAACSLDRLIGILKGKVALPPVMVSMWPQRLIAYNTALLYLTTTWTKWGGHLWQNGTANWYPARLAEFHRFPVPAFMNQVPVVYVTTYATLAVEFALGTLVFFRPLRGWVLLAGLILHGYIDYSMNIPLFSYLVTSLYITFYDGEEVAEWARRLGSKWTRWHVTIRMPNGMRLTDHSGAFLDAVDPFKLIHYVTGNEDRWSAIRQDGSAIPVSKAVKSRCPGIWLLALSPKFWPRFEANALQPAD